MDNTLFDAISAGKSAQCNSGNHLYSCDIYTAIKPKKKYNNYGPFKEVPQ